MKPFSNGKIHVCAEMCDTCIFRPGNLMSLDEGRVEQMVRDAKKAESCIPCHKTLYGQKKQEAVCHGFYKLHPTLPIRLAEVLGRIEFVEVKKK